MSPLQLLSFLLVLLTAVYVRAHPLLQDQGFDDVDTVLADLQRDAGELYPGYQKRWANQVRFGKRASWASSVRFG